MEIKEKIGLRIREIRLKKKMTQEGLAWEAEINRTFMNHIENGRKNISVETLEKVILALDQNFHSFFNEETFGK